MMNYFNMSLYLNRSSNLFHLGGRQRILGKKPFKKGNRVSTFKFMFMTSWYHFNKKMVKNQLLGNLR